MASLPRDPRSKPSLMYVQNITMVLGWSWTNLSKSLNHRSLRFGLSWMVVIVVMGSRYDCAHFTLMNHFAVLNCTVPSHLMHCYRPIRFHLLHFNIKWTCRLVVPYEHDFETLYQTCAINVITYVLPGVVMWRLFIGIVGYVLYVVPTFKVDTVKLAAFILVEGIHWIYLQHLFFSCSMLLHSGWLETHLFSICFRSVILRYILPSSLYKYVMVWCWHATSAEMCNQNLTFRWPYMVINSYNKTN